MSWITGVFEGGARAQQPDRSKADLQWERIKSMYQNEISEKFGSENLLLAKRMVMELANNPDLSEESDLALEHAELFSFLKSIQGNDGPEPSPAAPGAELPVEEDDMDMAA